MEKDLMIVVGTAFVRDGKLLISMSKRSAKKGKYTLVGGGVEPYDASIKAAARRECQEEIGNGFDILEEELEEVLVFREPSLSNPENLDIEMHMMLALKDVGVELLPNDEILGFKWHALGDDVSMVSTAIKDHFIPWAKENGVMY